MSSIVQDALFEEAESLPETVAEPDWAAWRGQIANTAVRFC